MNARCQICGARYPAIHHTLHLVVRHWEYIEALHNKPEDELEALARSKGV